MADEQLTTEEAKKLIMKYDRRFISAETALGPKQRLWKILDMFDRGQQWDLASMPPWVPKPVTNWIRYQRTLKRANLASTVPRPTFIPEYADDADNIRRLQKAHDHVWEQEKVPRLIRRAIDRAKLYGTAIVYVYTDDTEVRGRYFKEYDPKNQLFKGRICMKQIPIMNFFPDPDAYTLEDGKFHFFTERLPLNTIKNNPMFKAYAGEKLEKLKDAAADSNDTSSGEILHRDYHQSDTSSTDDSDNMVTLFACFERTVDEHGIYKMTLSYYLRNTDFFLYRVENAKPNEYPFAVLYDEEEDQDFHGSSDAQDILENQKVVNKVDQIAATIGVLHQNPQKIVSRESGINAQELARTGTMAGKVWVTNTDPAKSVHHLQPLDIPRSLMELKAQTSADIKEMTGVNEAYTGQSVGSLTTSTGVNSLIERATLRDKDKMIQIDAFVERLSHLIVLHILEYWKEERTLVTTGPDGRPQYDTWQPFEDEITRENLYWRVKSDVYAKAPTTQASRRDQADRLLQAQGQFNFNPPVIIPEEWIRFQDFDMKEEILQRMQRDRQRLEQQEATDMAQLIMQVAQQIQQAQAQGMTSENAQQIALQFVQQVLQQKEQDDIRNGRPADAAKEAQGPQGMTGQQAMMNMSRGM